MDSHLTVVDHPLIKHKLTLMRRKSASTQKFRSLLREVAHLLTYEITRDLELTTEQIETPLETMDAPVLAGKKLCFVSILRAGNGLLEGMVELLPSARVGHIGMYRDPETMEAVEYYCKMPEGLDGRPVIVVDPMLATGNSAIAAIGHLKKIGATNIRFLCLLAAPEGVAAMKAAHPDVPVWTAALDKRLDDHGYIRPGLGDAGDRMYGTK
ncbi:uracil phosphoribosyltransferase [Salinisphaera sp. Q1T1-3]|uniref:uracil phosphoribosyltransferase n=1 Tax=Salinisphaera sp. Q1T1-3 TaxID=2321229 RepID=UPI000E73725D|nr:uracil phosphoribosyltransferase [Salinisphaera sp. Q1T1-3]RJS91936.1 uracil phosphoribosyltransferase [Salinisphaera sp. Q1T1-3]